MPDIGELPRHVFQSIDDQMNHAFPALQETSGDECPGVAADATILFEWNGPADSNDRRGPLRDLRFLPFSPAAAAPGVPLGEGRRC